MSERRTILVSGGATGLGKALVEAAAANGYDVAINYRSGREQAERLAADLAGTGIGSVAIQGDVSLASDVDRIIRTTLQTFGRLDCLVNNAGVGQIIGLDDLDEQTFEQTVRINLTGAFLMSQAAWPHMKGKGGRLVFMSSGAARTGGNLSAAYAASKAGVEGLMHYYATNLRHYGITANAIAPALFESAMVGRMTVPPPAELPLGRIGRPDELWPVLRMILDTEYLTGQTIHVDAGRYMT